MASDARLDWLEDWLTLKLNLKGDRLQQRVVTSFARREGKPATVDLKIRGVRLLPRQALGVSLESAPPLQLLGPLEPPFGSFEVLYCEGPEGPPLAEGDSAADESLDLLCRQASLTSLALTPRHSPLGRTPPTPPPPPPSLPHSAPLGLTSASLPHSMDELAGFGNCASIRVVRTQQGYFSINRRVGPGEGWGAD